jgi:regulator of ribosome biosynthesis
MTDTMLENISKKANVAYDLGNLLINDTQQFKVDDITEEDIVKRGKENMTVFIEHLYKLSQSQKGENEEDRDFDKAPDNLKLPKPITLLPRAKPIPKPKPLTKWEKFRLEKGLQPRQRRSRMVYSELAGDWVPRWGKGSEKKLMNQSEWAIEEKPGQEGQDPFTRRKQEKKLNLMKEKKKEMKNVERNNKEQKLTNGVKSKSKNKSVEKNNNGEENGKLLNKKKKRSESSKRLKEETKNLSKTLEIAQKSSASMGKFDKKLKNEKLINPVKKSKVRTEVLMSVNNERNRDKKIMESLLKKTK